VAALWFMAAFGVAFLCYAVFAAIEYAWRAATVMALAIGFNNAPVRAPPVDRSRPDSVYLHDKRVSIVTPLARKHG